MYKMVKIDGTELGYADELTYIKVTSNGTYSPTYGNGVPDGIAFNGVAYNFVGRDTIPDAEEIIAKNYNSEELIKNTEQNTSNLDYISMMTGVDLPSFEVETEEI